MNENQSYLEVTGKSLCLLYAQDSHKIAPSIYILGSSIYFLIFDHGGSLTTCSFDIHKHPEKPLCILVDVSYECPSNSQSPASLGIDTTLHWYQLKSGKHWVKQLEITLCDRTSCQSSKRTIYLIKIIFISNTLLGQGTTVWEAKVFNRCKYVPMVVKDSWIDPLQKYTKGMILHLLNKK